MKSVNLYLLGTVLFSATAQVLMKIGSSRLGEHILAGGLIGFLLRVTTAPYILVGLGLYAISALFWIVVLNKAELSYAYPATAAAYIIVALLAWVLFHEQMTWTKAAALLLIGLGVALLGMSH